MRCVLALLAVAGCGGSSPPVVANQAPAEASPPRDCWLPEGCELRADIDGDARDDQIEMVSAGAQQGLRITLATGAVVLAGAGRAVAEMPGADPGHEPLPIEADLGFLVSVRVRAGRPPCFMQSIEISGTDAAAQLCVIAGEVRAFHLGF